MLVDIGTEWNLELVLVLNCLVPPVVDIGTEWNLEKYHTPPPNSFAHRRYRNRVEFREISHLYSVILRLVDIGTEWNLEFACMQSAQGRQRVDIGTEWNLEIQGHIQHRLQLW